MNPKALLQQALDLINLNKLSEAHNILLQVDKLIPNNIEVYHLLSVVYGMLSDYEQSETYCKKALAINSNAAVVQNNLGISQKYQGKYKDAEDSFLTTIKIQNNYIDAYSNLANLYLETENINKAEQLINTAMKIDRSNLALNLALGNLYLKQENHKSAINIYQNILDSQPQNTDAIINLGQIYEHSGETEKALKYYYSALDIIPNYDQSIIGIASTLEKKGQYNEALTIIEPAIKNSQNIKIHIIYSRIHSRLKDFSKAKNILLNASGMAAIDQHRQELLYELGDVNDKQALYDEAFDAYSKANKINKFEFDREDTARSFEEIKKHFTSESLKSLATSCNQSIQPVFIIGMPRSGTSLVEQILASHSLVFGAGEIEYIDDIIDEINTDKNTLYPHWIKDIETSTLNEKADKYIENSMKLSPDARFITNKMPHNFLHLGFIQQLFPKARIIHCTRNPKDTTLSIFFHQFNKNHPYASDLGDLNFYYQQYIDIMKHWQHENSLNMITINYESIINNPKKECERLINFCELPWEDDCLNFHKNKRLVNTPSYHQVKQPLYKNAVNRHKNYLKYLTYF